MQDARKQYDLPTYLGSWDPEDQVSKVSGEIIQPLDHWMKTFPHVLNHVKQQRYFQDIIILNISRHIINHEMKLMEMGGMEEIM